MSIQPRGLDPMSDQELPDALRPAVDADNVESGNTQRIITAHMASSIGAKGALHVLELRERRHRFTQSALEHLCCLGAREVHLRELLGSIGHLYLLGNQVPVHV